MNNETPLRHQLRLIHSWKEPWDVFFVKYGGLLLASTSALSGISINGYYRRTFGLRSYGKFGSILSTTMVPALMSFLVHTEYILPHVALQNMCPVCLQMRSAVLQGTIASAAPVVLAQHSTKVLTSRCGTFNLPSYTREPLKTFKFWKEVTRPISNVLFAIFVGQALLGSTVTFLESSSVKTVNRKKVKLEM